MREKKKYMVISFHSTTEAMSFEKQCIGNGIPGRLIPIPREITAGCGLAWRIPVEEYPLCRQAIQERRMEYQDVVELML
ncbi:MAG: DUF3343 domain-containing protein [Lachnospiraceae bacterium]|nr:DUF3343 domain-containing protein [Lachnospiraceae bacterium]MCI9545491.1 DUF3343 domain-containing protein [Lachnospiraceae bacterium]